MQPLVSILIPAYNSELWIIDTIKSALEQSWPRKEIIIVNDGSTDGTLGLAKQFECENLKILSQENSGASAARNRAFAECQGEYIQWLDADDLLSPDKISRQVELAAQGSSKRTLFSCAWGQFFYRPHAAKFVPTSLWQDLSPAEWLVLNLSHNYWMGNCSWLVSRELTEAAGPWDPRLSVNDDGEYFCRVVIASDAVRFTPDARVFYRSRPSSLSYVGRSRRKLEADFASKKLRIARVSSWDNSERVRAACVGCLKGSLSFFYPEMPDIVAEAQQLCAELGGGQLGVPKLPWKYAWIQKLCGWSTAKHAQTQFNASKASLLRCWDKALWRLGL